MRPSTGLRQRRANVNRLQLPTHLLLLLVRHRVGHHHFTQSTPVQRLNGLPAQDAVRDNGHHLLGSSSQERVGGFDERPTRIGHVVDDDGRLVPDVADEHHARDFIRLGTLFVDKGEAEV